jgi:hypothetical protein
MAPPPPRGAGVGIVRTCSMRMLPEAYSIWAV